MDTTRRAELGRARNFFVRRAPDEGYGPGMSDGSTGAAAQEDDPSSARTRVPLDLATAVLGILFASILGLVAFVGVAGFDGSFFRMGLVGLGAFGALALLGTSVALFRATRVGSSLQLWGRLAIAAAAFGGVPGLARSLGAAWGSERSEGGLLAVGALGLVFFGVGNLWEGRGVSGTGLRALAILTWLGGGAYVLSKVF